jgi:hypothetical protein
MELFFNRTDVINIRQAPKGWEQNDRYVYIGRAGRGQNGYFGNPFPLNGHEHGSTLQRFSDYACARMASDEDYARNVAKLRGKILVCFCKPHGCHGDILAILADR